MILRYRRPSQHPWVYRKLLGPAPTRLDPGALVELRTPEGEFVGRGFYNANSEITYRQLVQDVRERPDAAWFRQRIAEAVRFRRELLGLDRESTAYRLVHGEGDGLSGLVVDRLGDVLVAELFAAGMRRHWTWIQAALSAEFPGAAVLARGDTRAEELEGVSLSAPAPPVDRCEVVEHGLIYEVDLRHGHKTGFFADQREHRRRAAELCRGEDVLDACCYTGGFALSALRGGARSVEAIDLDEVALETARRNARRNGYKGDAPLTFRHINVFDHLRNCMEKGRRYDRIILDPPKMAATRDDVRKARAGYADMNRMAIECLRDGGILITCSCSGLVSEEVFLTLLGNVAGRARCDLQVFAVGGAGPDHPFSAHAPEGRYLKVVYARVRRQDG